MGKRTTREMVEIILTNDLPHIKERLVKLEVILGVLLLLGIGIAAGVIQSIFRWGL